MVAEPKDGVEAESGQVQTGLAAISVPGTDKTSSGASPWTSSGGFSPAVHSYWKLCEN